LKAERGRLQAELINQQYLTQQAEAIAKHRDKQLNELNLVLAAHNKRVEEDEALFQHYQQQQEALNSYIDHEMLDAHTMCLDVADVERLRNTWDYPKDTNSR